MVVTEKDEIAWLFNLRGKCMILLPNALAQLWKMCGENVHIEV